MICCRWNFLSIFPAPTSVLPVAFVGAASDGKTLDSKAIQAAIDASAQNGGGTVYFPAGRFLSGTITLKDNVTLYLSPEATLLGSPNAADYSARPFPARDLDVGGYEIWALVYAAGARNIGIEGKGTIDGNGRPFPPADHTPDVAGGIRPRAVFLKDCSRVVLRDVNIRESAMWSVHLAGCDKVFVHAICVSSSFFNNQDGIVLDSCREAFVSDCFVDTFDDAIVLKTSFPQPCRNISITNCALTTRCAAIKFGTQSLGAFQNIAVSNCTFYDCGLGGIKFFTVDGGDLEDITVSNLTMNNVAAPIFFRLGNRGFDFGFKEVDRPRPFARLRNVLVSGVRANVSKVERWPNRKELMRTGLSMGIAGIPGHPVEGVVLDNIHVTFPGGGTLEEAHNAAIPERENAYPENTMFGTLPAYGMYIRHARGVTLNNVRFELAKADLRPALVADDVEDLELAGFKAPGSGSEPLICLLNTRGALIRDSRPLGRVETFLRVEGKTSRDIALQCNDLRSAGRAAERAAGFTGKIAEAGGLPDTTPPAK